jgi:hypothetical protein
MAAIVEAGYAMEAVIAALDEVEASSQDLASQSSSTSDSESSS